MAVLNKRNFLASALGAQGTLGHFGEEVIDSSFKNGLESWYDKSYSQEPSDTDYRKDCSKQVDEGLTRDNFLKFCPLEVKRFNSIQFRLAS